MSREYLTISGFHSRRLLQGRVANRPNENLPNMGKYF